MRPVYRVALGVAVIVCALALMAADFRTMHDEQRGVVRGVVVRPPGRDPRSGNGAAVHATVPVSGDVVRATDRKGHEVATSVTGDGGRFEFALSPGVYRIAEDICGVGRQVEVRSRVLASVTLVMPEAC